LNGSLYPHRSSARAGRVTTAATSSAPATTLLDIDLSPFPAVPFFKIEAVVRPWRIESVLAALSMAGILGVTVQSSVQGVGAQGGRPERYGGAAHGLDSVVEKSLLWAVVGREQVAPVAAIIVGAARTGEQGDGKLFVSPVADVIRVRTGETGASAERMEGGMADRRLGVVGQ
jgi:nitrogen regulatory protein PII